MRTANPDPRYGFRGEEFYVAVAQVLRKRNVSWRALAGEIGISASTFTRWGRGRSLDARVLAALAAWTGLNPADYVGLSPARAPLQRILGIIDADPELSAEAAADLQRLVRIAYEESKQPAPGSVHPG
jgi:transcriptional regulator with XRE-family HTH domain